MPFQALEVALDTIRSLRAPARLLGRRDARLADQLRRAASSIALNLAEGNRRRGHDRRYHFHVAAGSADEVRTALRVALAWGWLDPRDVEAPMALLDRVLAMVWKLTR